MKKLRFILFLFFLVIISCEKTDNDSRELDNYLSISTGDTYELCYQKLQDLYNENQIISMYVQHSGFASIENYPEIIPLYSEFQIVNNGSDTINFTFSNDSLISIYCINIINPLTAGPTYLVKWPDDIDEEINIGIGDIKTKVFETLQQIESEGESENNLKRIIYTIKDLNTLFDPHSKNSDLWSILQSEDYFFEINFKDGMVKSINKKEVEVRALN